MGFPDGSADKESTWMQETQELQVQSLDREDPLKKGIATTPVFLPEKSHGQRSLVGYSLMGCKESDMTEWLSTAQLFWVCELQNYDENI